jgi:hypothetical protein
MSIEIRTQDYTAYAVAVIINQILNDEGFDRQVPPQMMYNYTRNGLIAKRTKGQPAKTVRYTATEVSEFVNRWFAKNYKVENVTYTQATLVDPFATFTGTEKVSLVRK